MLLILLSPQFHPFKCFHSEIILNLFLFQQSLQSFLFKSLVTTTLKLIQPMVNLIPYSFLSMNPNNVASHQTQQMFITSPQGIMISDKISRLNQEKQCFLLQVPLWKETSYSNKEPYKVFKVEVLFMAVESTKLLIHLFLQGKWEKD